MHHDGLQTQPDSEGAVVGNYKRNILPAKLIRCWCLYPIENTVKKPMGNQPSRELSPGLLNDGYASSLMIHSGLKGRLE